MPKVTDLLIITWFIAVHILKHGLLYIHFLGLKMELYNICSKKEIFRLLFEKYSLTLSTGIFSSAAAALRARKGQAHYKNFGE